jgi:hypothetical protein
MSKPATIFTVRLYDGKRIIDAETCIYLKIDIKSRSITIPGIDTESFDVIHDFLNNRRQGLRMTRAAAIFADIYDINLHAHMHPVGYDIPAGVNIATHMPPIGMDMSRAEPMMEALFGDLKCGNEKRRVTLGRIDRILCHIDISGVKTIFYCTKCKQCKKQLPKTNSSHVISSPIYHSGSSGSRDEIRSAEAAADHQVDSRSRTRSNHKSGLSKLLSRSGED